jgi:hypothetical protein
MKIVLMEPRAVLYSEMDQNSTPLKELVEGEEAETGQTLSKGLTAWMPTMLPDGLHGYLLGTVRIRKALSAIGRDVDLYEQPSEKSTVAGHYKAGSLLYLLGSVEVAQKGWLKARDLLGNEGFVDENVGVFKEPQHLVIGLMNALKDTDPAVRLGGCTAAGSISFVPGIEPVFNTLNEMIGQEREIAVRRAARTALRKLKGFSAHDDEVMLSNSKNSICSYCGTISKPKNLIVAVLQVIGLAIAFLVALFILELLFGPEAMHDNSFILTVAFLAIAGGAVTILSSAIRRTCPVCDKAPMIPLGTAKADEIIARQFKLWKEKAQ